MDQIVTAPQDGIAAEAEGVKTAPKPATARRPHVPTHEQIRRALESGRYPYRGKLRRPAYEQEKAQLQAELLKVQL